MPRKKTELRNQLLTIGLGMTLFASLSVFAQTNTELNSSLEKNVVENQYIIVLKDSFMNDTSDFIASISTSNIEPESINKSLVKSISEEIAQKYNAELRYEYSTILSGFAISVDGSELEEILKDERIAYIEQDQVIKANVIQNNATWGLDRIDQADLPLDNEYNYDYSGKGVNVYVVDSGIYSSHPDFDGRVGSGADFIDDGNNTEDCDGHGTHVAGTIGSETYGVAKDVTLIPVRVLDCNGSGFVSTALAGLDWVLENAPTSSVVNMSLSGGSVTSYESAINSLVDKNITVVVAAGNDNDDACDYAPSGVHDAITVAASTSLDLRASFSNYGDCVDIFAPGKSILSTSIGGSSTFLSGTSMASPHVAGVAALYLEKNPTANPHDVVNALQAQAATNKIVDNLGSPNLLVQTQFNESSILSINNVTDWGGSNGSYSANNVIDGSLEWESRWEAIGLPSNLVLDLGSVQNVTDIGISFGKGRNFTYGFEVWARATTGETWTKVLKQTNTSGTTSSIVSYDITDIDAQYVRIKTRSNTGETDKTIIKEVELYGKNSLSSGVVINTAFDDGSSINQYTPLNAIDNNTDFESRWSASNGASAVNLILELDDVSSVASMDIAWGLGDQYIYEFEVYARPDTRGAWTKVYDSFSSGTTSDFEKIDLVDIDAKQVRIKSLGNDSGNQVTDIKEVKIYRSND